MRNSTAVLPVILGFLLAHDADAATVIHCKMRDNQFPSGRHESWIVTDTHLHQLGGRYEWLDLAGLAHKKITSRSEGVLSATWDHTIESSYSFEVSMRTGAAVETSISRLVSKRVYGNCWIIDRELDGALIPPHEEWKIH